MVGSYSYIENVRSKTALKSTLDERFTRTVKRWSQKPEFMDDFTQRALNLRAFTSPLATFVIQQMDITVSELHENAKKEFQLTGEILDPAASSSPSDTSSRKCRQELALQKLENVHSRI